MFWVIRSAENLLSKMLMNCNLNNPLFSSAACQRGVVNESMSRSGCVVKNDEPRDQLSIDGVRVQAGEARLSSPVLAVLSLLGNGYQYTVVN